MLNYRDNLCQTLKYYYKVNIFINRVEALTAMAVVVFDGNGRVIAVNNKRM